MRVPPGHGFGLRQARDLAVDQDQLLPFVGIRDRLSTSMAAACQMCQGNAFLQANLKRAGQS